MNSLKKIIIFFKELALKKRLSASPVRFMSLKLLQAASLLLHPANSWGFPLEIGQNIDLNQNTLSGIVLLKLIGKALIFSWRVLILATFSVLIVRILRSFNARKGSVKYLSPVSLLTVLGSVTLSSSLLLFIGYFSALEHRYLFPVVSWVELPVCLFLLVRLSNRDSIKVSK